MRKVLAVIVVFTATIFGGLQSASAWKCEFHPEKPNCTPPSTTVPETTVPPTTVPETTTTTTTVPEVPPTTELAPPVSIVQPPKEIKITG